MKGILYLEDGTTYVGNGFGKVGTSVGELVFNTCMTGYQEILTDPSYAGQIINMTYPMIGNYGVNSYENESEKIYARGLVVKTACTNPSNYMSEGSIDEMLKNMNIVGICDVDTRAITKKIRNAGAMKCIISNKEFDMDKLKKIMDGKDIRENYVKLVSTKEVKHIKGSGFKVAIMDFGAKGNIIENLKQRNCDITIFPYNTSYNQIMSIKPDGVFLTNGPGDPKKLEGIISTVKSIINSVPTFGICLGHQIIALAVGGDTYKLKFGHRGGNHGVYDIERDKAYITSQNHGYTVDPKSVEDKGMIITHKNLNDDTVEGMKHKSLPVFSVQFHPEGAPGPTDTAYLFDKFIRLMEKNVKDEAI